MVSVSDLGRINGFFRFWEEGVYVNYWNFGLKNKYINVILFYIIVKFFE